MANGTLNGVDVEAITAFRDAVRLDASAADRRPVVVARWLGGSRSEVECDGVVTHVGGEGELNPMRMLLGCLVACDVDVVAMHASLMGIPIETLVVEARGHFNVQRYMGIESDVAPGYQEVDYVVRIRAPAASDEQIERLRALCEHGSPVGDTLERRVRVSLSFEAS
jgi:uncharacterized OsmC-like protein